MIKKTEELFSNGKMILVKDSWLQNSIKREYIYLKKQNAVLIIAIKDGEIFFVRQYRHTVGKDSLELPGGRIEKNEFPHEAAIRELEEETGLSEPKTIILLGEFFPLLSITNEKIYVFLMMDLKQKDQNLNESESDLRVEKIKIKKIKEFFQKGIISGPDILALHLYFSFKS